VEIPTERVQPLLAVAAASETDIPFGKSILRIAPEIILEEVVNVKVYWVFGFEAMDEFVVMKVGVIVPGVMTRSVVELSSSTVYSFEVSARTV